MIPNYTCRREKKAAALLTGTSWATSAHIGRLLNLYKYPQVRDKAVREQETGIKLQTLNIF